MTDVESNLYEGYETVEFSSIQIPQEDFINKKIYLFQAPADFDSSKLHGVTLNLKTDEDQEFEQEGEITSIVVSKQDKETQKYMKKQILPLFPEKKSSKLNINQKISGFYKIFKKISFPKISKKAIRKTKPIILKQAAGGDQANDSD